MFASLSRGWALTKTSFQVLKLDKEILALPLMAGVLMFFAFVGLGLGMFPLLQGGDIGTLVALFVIYVAVYAIAIFFNVAVIEMATIRFNGGDPVIKDGLRKASSRMGRILQWALVAATVGLIFRILRDQARDSFIAQLLLGLIEGAWNFVTFFAVPIAVYRDVGPMAAIKGSTSLVRRTFGETATGIWTTSLVFLLLGLLAIIPGFLGFMLLGAGQVVLGYTLIALAVVYVVAVVAVNSAVDGILVAALYKYANEGVMPQALAQQGITGENIVW